LEWHDECFRQRIDEARERRIWIRRQQLQHEADEQKRFQNAENQIDDLPNARHRVDASRLRRLSRGDDWRRMRYMLRLVALDDLVLWIAWVHNARHIARIHCLRPVVRNQRRGWLWPGILWLHVCDSFR